MIDEIVEASILVLGFDILDNMKLLGFLVTKVFYWIE